MEPTAWDGVFRDGRDLYTPNHGPPGDRVYGEKLRTAGTTEYRQWDPFRSKLAALCSRGGVPADLWSGARSVLYLGGAHGTTVSHLADILPEARIYVIEKSPTAFAPLLALSQRRSNLYPILADAQLPERYRADVGLVDLLYQDVAQRNQAAIFVENARAVLGPRGRGIFMLKVRSVTQTRPSVSIAREARTELERAGLEVRAEVGLSPFARDHVALVTRTR
ncbi:MAG: fibrillarin-like rRNA/tRNA 2'-O-methyltransferase [Thermoplasmata archaeon]